MAELSDFYFKILYRSRRSNGDADALSRLPHHYQELCCKETSTDTIDAIINGITVGKQGHSTWITTVNVENYQANRSTSSKTVTSFNDADLLDAQLKDPVPSCVLNFKQQGEKQPVDELKMEPPYVKILLREWDLL